MCLLYMAAGPAPRSENDHDNGSHSHTIVVVAAVPSSDTQNRHDLNTVALTEG